MITDTETLKLPEQKPMTVEDIFHNIGRQTNDLSIQMIADLKRVVKEYEGAGE